MVGECTSCNGKENTILLNTMIAQSVERQYYEMRASVCGCNEISGIQMSAWISVSKTAIFFHHQILDDGSSVSLRNTGNPFHLDTTDCLRFHCIMLDYTLAEFI